MAETAPPWENIIKAYPDDGTPTQESVNQDLKYYSDIIAYLNSIEDEIKSYRHSSPKDRKEKIEKLQNNINTNIKSSIEEKKKEDVDDNPIVKKIEERMKIIEPLIKPPTSIDDVLEYLTSVAAYFMGPYKSLILCGQFYINYIKTIGERISQILISIANIEALLKEELAKIDTSNLDKSIKEMEELKISNDLSKELKTDTIYINRYKQ